jgi:hypothetical protein
VLVAEEVLAAQEHLQFGLLADFLDVAQALPRVFVEVAQARVEGRAAPALDGVVAGVVDVLDRRRELRERHTGGDEGLVGVAEDCFGEHHFWHNSDLLMVDFQRKSNKPPFDFL